MTQFNKGDKVRRIGTTQPLYRIMGKTSGVNSSSPDDYLKSKEDYYTCTEVDSTGGVIELRSSEIELVEPFKY